MSNIEYRTQLAEFRSVGRDFGMRVGLWVIPAIALGLIACSDSMSPPLNPEQAIASFQLPPDLRIELVASEPMIQDPVSISFDEKGRLWVVEMRGFMPDIDGTGEDLPTGRVSVLLDRDGDGQMDSSVVFLDSLVLPRAIAIAYGGVLIAENIPLWFAKDTNGDLRADIKTLVDLEYGGRGIPEHSPNGLWRGMDNWYYNAKSKHRYRMKEGIWIKEETEFRGQWGICHDDAGRLFYNYNWSQLHADLVPPNYLSRNPHHLSTSGIDHPLTSDRRVYPIRSNTAVNRGYVPGTLDDQGRIIEFASATAPFIYRGDAMGEAYLGNAFVCEPTGNLIKRKRIEQKGWHLQAREAYKGREFLASTDERFRPIFLSSGPDGAVYVVDMYRGIIQHGPYMSEYLREETLKRGLDQHIHLGRIWRIIAKDAGSFEEQALPQDNLKQLTDFLSHSNGWYRDLAQRLLVEKNDKRTIQLLKNLIVEDPDPLARLHALWTLEGLKYPNPDMLLAAWSDSDPRVQATAIRLLEPFCEKNSELQKKVGKQLSDIWENAPPMVQLQIALSAPHFGQKQMMPILEGLISTYPDSAVMRDAVMSSLNDQEVDLFRRLWISSQWQTHSPGKEIFLELLATAIGKKGDSLERSLLLASLEEDGHAPWKTNALRAGLLTSQHPSESSQEKQLAPLTDEQRKQLALGRQQYLTVCSGCHGTDGKGIQRFAPPLVDSEWVSGDEKRLILLALHGMQGPVSVNGKLYDAPEIMPVMPSFAVMDNGDLAAILTYIRQQWGKGAEPVSPATVVNIRYRTQGKITPWTAEELMQDISIPD